MRIGIKHTSLAVIVLSVGAMAWALSYGPLRYMFAPPPSSPQMSALQNLKSIGTSESVFHLNTGKERYGSLEELAESKLLSECLSKGECGEYRFEIRLSQNWYEAVATPERYGGETRMSYYTSADGKLHGSDKRGAEADASDPLIEQ
jgi:hypothetical protein